MKIKLRGFVFIIMIFTGSYLYSQTSSAASGAGIRAGNTGTMGTGFSRGESLFKENNARDAVQVLEYEILNGQISENSYNFLGLGYYQLGEYEKSIDAFRRGLKAQPDNAKILSYNMGNSYYALKDYNSAIGSYSDALKADPNFYDAVLNRANALLMSGQLLSAKEEYIDFINKAPDNPQRERIELLIAALEEEIARREEEARLLAEQNKAQWEEYDGSLAEKKNREFIPDWEQVERDLADDRKEDENPEWEKINGDNPGAVTEDSSREKVLDTQNKDNSNEYWEEFEHDSSSSFVKTEEVVTDKEEWLTFSDEELDEIKELDRQSQKEHEEWLENERRREQELARREAQARQKKEENALEEERKLREQLLEEMRKSEDERRKKLLEDVANSLQSSDSTNLTSGAEDLIDYDLEGELD